MINREIHAAELCPSSQPTMVYIWPHRLVLAERGGLKGQGGMPFLLALHWHFNTSSSSHARYTTRAIDLKPPPPDPIDTTYDDEVGAFIDDPSVLGRNHIRLANEQRSLC